MPEELTTERMSKIKEAAKAFRDNVAAFFKDFDVEVKDWKFAVENSEKSYILDASVRVLVKPKKS